MDTPVMLAPREVVADTTLLPSYLPVPGFGVLPVNAFVIDGREPVLVDTGLGGLREPFLEALWSVVAPESLQWIWLTHADPDHLGNLGPVLEQAPQARVVTTYLGMGKMGLHGLPVDRVYLLNPGQELALADRRLRALVPPTFDAPETTGLYDSKSRALFSSDCFGALMECPMDVAMELAAEALRAGVIGWARADAPWLGQVDPVQFHRSLDAIRALQPDIILSSHLPPAEGMLETLAGYLADAPSAPAFEGPDQAQLEHLMAAAVA